MRFTKIVAGWYATPDGKFAVINDGLGHVTIDQREGSGVMAGITGGEWGAVHDPSGGLRTDNRAGENLDWFETKREAIEFLARLA